MIEVAQLLIFAAPVAFAALGETVGQKSGIINIGLEGVMLLSAFIAAMMSLNTNSAMLGVLAGAAVGLALTVMLGWFVIRLAVDQVVAGTALNLFAMGLSSTLFRSSFGQSGKLLSVPGLPRFWGIDPALVLLLISVPLVSFLLYRTKWGLAVRASGENPSAAEGAGLSVSRLRFGAIAVAGLLGGVGGAYLALGVNGSFAENMTAGRGFIAIALVTFGRWKPVYVFLAALLIGYLESLQFVFQARSIQVPYQLLLALPYIVALVVLIFAGKGSAAPSALAQPYRRER